jgi:3-deoxy-D-manno-octulosonate 8-phosphate phosphatase (KDO 8-P phosphatase)
VHPGQFEQPARIGISMSEALAREKARAVRWLVLDVDGVLTDGRIVLDGGDGEWKSFDVRDGQRLVLAARAGIRTVFLTGRTSKVVERRAAELGVHRVFQGAREKGAVMERFLGEEGAAPEQVAYLGDDIVDLPAMRRAGLAAAVGDAVPEVQAAADWIAASRGGRGAVRELVEFILVAQGRWDALLAEYRR